MGSLARGLLRLSPWLEPSPQWQGICRWGLRESIRDKQGQVRP